MGMGMGIRPKIQFFWVQLYGYDRKTVDVICWNTGGIVFECKKCRNPKKIVNRSKTNLKSHLGRAHKMIKFLTSSQLRHFTINQIRNQKLVEKRKIN